MSTPYSPVTTKARRLQAQAAEAAEVRDALTHPDVVALRVERIRGVTDRFIWVGMVLGLLFTMTNVQQFAAHTAGSSPGSLGWWASWLLDPTVSVILLGVLLAERESSRHRVPMDGWARVAKWGLLAATYVMNTWESYTGGSLAGIVLHSVPVLAVFVGAEAVTSCNDALTRAVDVALTRATERAARKATVERDVQAATAERDGGPGPIGPGYPAVGPARESFHTLQGAGGPARPGFDPSTRPDPLDPGSPVIDPRVDPVSARSDSARAERVDPPKRRPARPKSDEQLVAAVRDLTEQSGQPPSVYQLRQQFGIGGSRAARLLAGLELAPAASPISNGAAIRKEGTR
ncbi:MAG: hypothetical protein ACRDSP_00040 [Pseudonocardiaceae bacterium]